MVDQETSLADGAPVPVLDVLVVDDDPSVAESTADILEAAGLSAEFAVSVSEARRVISDRAVRSVVIDHLLAEEGPASVELDLQSVPSLIVVSGLRPAEVAGPREVRGRAVAAFLAKPVPPDELVAVVREATAVGDA